METFFLFLGSLGLLFVMERAAAFAGVLGWVRWRTDFEETAEEAQALEISPVAHLSDFRAGDSLTEAELSAPKKVCCW